MATADPSPAARDQRTAADLARAIEALESVDWTATPGVSAVTAATFARQLRWARAAVEG